MMSGLPRYIPGTWRLFFEWEWQSYCVTWQTSTIRVYGMLEDGDRRSLVRRAKQSLKQNGTEAQQVEA